MDLTSKEGQHFDLLLLTMALVAGAFWVLSPSMGHPHFDVAGFARHSILAAGTSSASSNGGVASSAGLAPYRVGTVAQSRGLYYAGVKQSQATGRSNCAYYSSDLAWTKAQERQPGFATSAPDYRRVILNMDRSLSHNVSSSYCRQLSR